MRDSAEPERKSVPKAEQNYEGQERGHESSRGSFGGLRENDVHEEIPSASGPTAAITSQDPMRKNALSSSP
jgi:hypothetical protein